MTRSFRAIRLPRVLFALPGFCTALAAVFGSTHAVAAPALASTLLESDPFATDAALGDDSAIRVVTKEVAGGRADVSSRLPPDAGIQIAPTVETPLHHFYCVEYARLRSGLQIFGDARTWWQHAQKIYVEFTQPSADAVMVFAGSKRIARGHLAVVTQVVSPREIRVDQANWQNHGEIDRYTPVLDVSANNDWSKVRVWDMRSGEFGARIYAIKGFIARAVAAQQEIGAAFSAQAAVFSAGVQAVQ